MNVKASFLHSKSADAESSKPRSSPAAVACVEIHAETISSRYSSGHHVGTLHCTTSNSGYQGISRSNIDSNNAAGALCGASPTPKATTSVQEIASSLSVSPRRVSASRRTFRHDRDTRLAMLAVRRPKNLETSLSGTSTSGSVAAPSGSVAEPTVRPASASLTDSISWSFMLRDGSSPTCHGRGPGTVRLRDRRDRRGVDAS
mmetsp:Transcript_4865/g.14739  ORF Transcript_4865/g.14739 Transcript_4865/m.14739 type:complete len:202 (-) Transcript_4865:61-666(-)